MNRLAFTLLALAACGGGMHEETKTDLRNAAILSGMAYQHEDASTPSAALVRGAHCAAQAALEAEKLGPTDSGIPCNH